MKYFAKYLPVEGEIKEGDKALKSNGKIVYVNKAAAKHLTKDWKKAKLFLCSRDIQVDDEVTDGLTKWITRVALTGTPDCTDTGGYKVIGEISRDALSYVKEGDEFDEPEVQKYITLGMSLGRTEDPNIWEIKGPCGHFH